MVLPPCDEGQDTGDDYLRRMIQDAYAVNLMYLQEIAEMTFMEYYICFLDLRGVPIEKICKKTGLTEKSISILRRIFFDKDEVHQAIDECPLKMLNYDYIKERGIRI